MNTYEFTSFEAQQDVNAWAMGGVDDDFGYKIFYLDDKIS